MTATMRKPTDAAYRDKPPGYFGNPRLDIVEMLNTTDRDAVLELGCGDGATGAATLACGKAGRYVGIELSQKAAALAAGRLTDVLVGDVETLDLSALEGRFDALILGEVLEHLNDPWTVLKRLVACLRPGAEVHASSPNVAHYKVILGLLRGSFEYLPSGVMDRTHLRWFTPRSFRRMFVEAGVEVDELRPLRRWVWHTRALHVLAGGRLMHLYAKNLSLRGHKRG